MIPQPAVPPAGAPGEAFERSCYEAIGLWESGWRIWLEYVSDLAGAVTPEAVMQANIRLFARCLEAPGLAAGELQRDGGLPAPTLHEA